MSRKNAVILLAGMGSRLGRPYPKSLTQLDYGETILARQVRILKGYNFSITAVVGYKKDLIMEAVPDVTFAYNPNYDTTNTSKSLIAGLRNMPEGDVLWMNGDVVFDARVIERVLSCPSSAVAVNNCRVGEEEVKYTVNDEGFIDAISKTVAKPLGEALGVNLIKGEFVQAFMEKLAEVNDNDYFERGMELLIEEKRNVFRPVDVGDLKCVEVDFADDLANANMMFAGEKK